MKEASVEGCEWATVRPPCPHHSSYTCLFRLHVLVQVWPDQLHRTGWEAKENKPLACVDWEAWLGFSWYGSCLHVKVEYRWKASQWSLSCICHKRQIKQCYLGSVQKASLYFKIQASLCYPTLLCLCFPFRSTHTFPNHSMLSSPQENLYRVHTKTLVPVLSDSLLSRGRPFLCSPSTFDYSVRRAFVVSEGRSCSHGNVLSVRLLLLDTSRENRLQEQHHNSIKSKRDPGIIQGET